MADSLAVERWESWVRLREESDLSRELVARLRDAVEEPSLTVSDLLDPRSAYYRRTHPVPFTAEQEHRLELGRAVHARIEAALAIPAFREVRLRRGAIVGQIDILDRFPIELKSTASLPSLDRVAEDRPEYVDQLGMYCALVDAPEGRLILARMQDTEVAEVAVADMRFDDLAGIRGEMEERARTLREAVRAGDPTGLPRCPWFGRGCPFESGGVCVCTGAESTLLPLARHAGSIAENRLEAGRVMERLTATRESSAGGVRFRDLLYPRRAFFEARDPKPGPARRRPPESAPGPTGDPYRIVLDALERGPAGENVRVVASPDFPEDRVMLFRQVPTVLKTTRARPARSPREVVTRFPQYALELLARTSVLGADSGRLLIAHEGPGPWEERLRTYRVEITEAGSVSGLVRERLEQLRATHESGDVAPCPGWMYSGCPYRAECACGPATPSRS